ncbi:MAG: GAF domain-containing protein [Chloroflexaceae bacterium]
MRSPIAIWRALAGQLSLASRLTIAMLVVASLAMVGLFFELSRANRQEIERLQTTALQHSAVELARRLDDLVRSERSRVANLALSRSAQEFIAAPPERRAPLFTPTLADFGNFLDSNQPFYRAVLLLDRRGEVLLATDGSYIGLHFSDSAFLRAAAEGETYMSDPGISPLDRKPVIWLSAPVRRPGATVTAPPDGVLAVALALEEVWEAVERVRIGEHGYAMLIDGYGIRLAHGRDRRYVFRALAPLAPDDRARLQREGRFADLPSLADTGNHEFLALVRAAPPRPVLSTRSAPEAARVFYSVAALTTRDWTVVAMLSEREVLAPAVGVTLRGMAVTLVVVLLLGLTVAWAAQRLARPLPRLAAAAQRIASGDLTAPVQVEGSSEIRALARNFETMRWHLAQAQDELAAWAASLEARVARRSQELAALAEVVAMSSHQRSQEALLYTALDQTLPVIGAEMGGIWLGEADGGLRLAVWAGFDSALQRALSRFAAGEGLLGQVHQQGEPMALTDISQSPRLSRAIVREQRLHAFAGVPLLVSGRSLGVLGVFSHLRGGFSPEALTVVTAIGQQIALALENLSLLARVEEQARNVAALQERERLAGEIHDGVAQNLSYLYMQLDRLANYGTLPASLRTELARLQGVLEATTEEVRRLIARLQDPQPAPVSLEERLREVIRALNDEAGCSVNLTVAPGSDVRVPAPVEAEIGRIVGEAIRNAARHGRATYVGVELERQGDLGRVRVRDNGSGFDPASVSNNGHQHFGLKVMRARAQRIGGTLVIESRPGAGACVELVWSLQRATLAGEAWAGPPDRVAESNGVSDLVVEVGHDRACTDPGHGG